MQSLYCREIAKGQYQIVKLFSIQTPIFPEEPIVKEFYILHMDGLLELRPGYAWNGGDWPAIDTLNMIYASAIHDPFCQMLHAQELSWQWRVAINQFFVSVLKQIGKINIKRGPKFFIKPRLAILNARCKWVYRGVDKLGPNPRKRWEPKDLMIIPTIRKDLRNL